MVIEEINDEKLQELLKAKERRLEIVVHASKREAIERLRDFILKVQSKSLRVWIEER